MNRERRFGRLGRSVYEALVDGTALCQSSQHRFVELDHWLSCIWQRKDSDIRRFLKLVEANPDAFNRRLQAALSRLATAQGGIHDLSGTLEATMASALGWVQITATGSEHVRSGHLLLAGLEDTGVRRWLESLAPEFKGQPLEKLVAAYEAEAGSWPEAHEVAVDGRASARPASPAADVYASGNGDGGLQHWANSMSRLAEEGALDPVVGRDAELRQVIDVLLRRRQNNPILVGEAGVGKSAIAEALALRVHHGDVPPALRNAQVWALDLGRMQAGAGARGEFEQRLRNLLDAVIASPCPIILFCDEVHTLIGAGGTAGTGDAANLIKPMLARGQLRMIAATTWSEYKQFIEPDAALTRRFQAISVDEPTDDIALVMLRVAARRFASHHGVRIADIALEAAVKLSRRHLPGRQLPDKAISLLDTACARVAISLNSAPGVLDRLNEELLQVEQALAWRSSDEAMGLVVEKDQLLQERQAQLEVEIAELGAQVQQQRDEVMRMLGALEAGEAIDRNNPAHNYAAKLLDRRDSEPLWVRPFVDDEVIATVLSEWTGVPCDYMATDDAHNLVHLEENLRARIHGQDAALHHIAGALQVARAGLNDPQRPLGVFMLAGPTGTGKSETAAALADLLFGGTEHVIHFNMNEFQESHTVSTLKGAPPGYVGFGKGGRLTEAVRRRPYSVVLLDEFDRAHRDVHEIFYQVFDRGWMEDGEGRRIDFRNCLILLTSNLGGEQIEKACEQDPSIRSSVLNGMVHDAMSDYFAAPLLARMQVVAFRPLGRDALVRIAERSLEGIRQRLEATGVALEADESVREWVAEVASKHPASGRAARDLLAQTAVPVIAEGLLKGQLSERRPRAVLLSAKNGLGVEFIRSDDEIAVLQARQAAGVADTAHAHPHAPSTPEIVSACESKGDPVHLGDAVTGSP
ncbi:type VI secretion system ATPase TssH [Paraburkholderia susongensis]|uniref:Type VI secretion system protein VasG n=1 Tax=Paraburkholderia susongensis TaxID=1515439 RepID=A0A1X7M4W1_9BURK|nr:type VI secretion system ATPase TssH [Paraburkholderia susongensis]SMG61135.1 type VI secretion system protein VasG [Paraburkholderia susongensis]